MMCTTQEEVVGVWVSGRLTASDPRSPQSHQIRFLTCGNHTTAGALFRFLCGRQSRAFEVKQGKRDGFRSTKAFYQSFSSEKWRHDAVTPPALRERGFISAKAPSVPVIAS